MRAITAEEVKLLENYALKMGIPGRILMEIAGMKVANIAAHEIKRVRYATVVCGNGGNGGDGFVAARYLHNAGIRTDIYLTSAENRITAPDSRANYDILKNMGLDIVEINENNMSDFKQSLLNSDIVIDAIFGIGFKGEIKGPVENIFDLINTSKREVKNKRHYLIVSVDVPSGIDLAGTMNNKCVEADITITFDYPKIGLLKYPASRSAGKIITTSIGIPKPNLVEPDFHTYVEPQRANREAMEGVQITDSRYVSSVVPRRKVDAHKGDSGQILVIAGSSGMMGAAVLTSNSAMRTGTGLVTLCVPENIKNYVNSMSLEAVVTTVDNISNKASQAKAIALGPGLSTGKDISKLIRSVLTDPNIKVPIILDADGLNALDDVSLLKKSGKDIIITPHPGEFSRLIKVPAEEIQKDRIAKASTFAVENGVTVVLKGAYTVIAGSDRSLFVNPTGNPAMASAGVGDVLTGIITSLAGQGMSSFNAAIAGVYIHSMAANLATSIKGEHGLIASDIIDSIPFAMESIL